MRKLVTFITTLALASGPAMAEPAAGDDMAGFLAEKGFFGKDLSPKCSLAQNLFLRF